MGIKANTEGLWQLYCTMGNGKEEADHSTEQILKTLDSLSERLSKRIGEDNEEMESCQGQLDTLLADTEHDHGQQITHLRARIAALEHHMIDLQTAQRKAEEYRELLIRAKKEYANAFRAGRKKVNQYLAFLEFIMENEEYQKYQSDQENQTGRFHSMTFRGITFYCDDEEIDLQKTDASGRTNLKRMEKGLAPLGKDGLPMNLHHVSQREDGTIMELSQTVHQKNHYQLHTNTNDIPSGINRNNFNVLKAAYWKRRAAFLSKSQK